MLSLTLQRVGHHGYEDITLGADDCTAHGRATVARTEAKLLILCGISGSRVLAQHAVNEFVRHYHEERNHQALGNRLIEPESGVGQTTGELCCQERLGGLLRYYYRQAA